MPSDSTASSIRTIRGRRPSGALAMTGLAALLTGLGLATADAAPTTSPPQSLPGALVEELWLDRLGSEHGLSHNSVSAILQDRRGFLWIGTRDGLCRYDGYEFRVYRPRADDRLSARSSYVRALAETKDGRLWVGTETGLYRLEPARSRWTPVEGLDARDGDGLLVLALHASGDGTLWIGTDRGLFSVDARQPSAAAEIVESWSPAPHVESLRADRSGRVWALGVAGSSGMLWPVDDPDRRHPIDGSPLDFRLDAGDAVWIDVRSATERRTLDTQGRQADAARLDARGPQATAVAVDRQGRTWIGTHQGLYVAAREETPRRVRTAATVEHALTDEVTSIVVDRAGAVWIGTFGGVLRHDPRRKAFRHFGHRENDRESLSSDHVSGVTRDRSGTLWVATYGAGINEIDLGNGRVVRHRSDPARPGSLCDDYVWAIIASRRSRLYLGTSAGLCELDEAGRFRLRDDGTTVAALAEAPDGTVWLGTTSGLVAWEPVGGTRRRVASISEWIDVVHVTGAGIVWAASGSSGDMIRHDPATGRTRTFEDLAPAGVLDFREDTDGSVLLATGAGLARLETGPAGDPALRWLWRGSPEHGSIVYSVQPDAAGRLWLGTSKGLVRLTPGDPDRPGLRNYDLGDNLGNLEFNRKATYRAPDGTLFFGGMDGLTYFDPDAIADDPTPPPVVLTAVRALGDAGERTLLPAELRPLTLEPTVHAVSFEFVALDFRLPPRSRYAYRLDGFDADWIDSGEQRTARYTNLPPGRYVFRVRGANADGVWNEAGVALPVEVLPPWWRTWWFRVAVIVAGVLALTVAYRLRIARLRALDRMRLRIAGDLHDDLGSDLSGIAMLSGVVGQREYLEGSDRSHMAEIESTALRVMEGLRDIVWYITPEHDNLAAMARRMRTVADRLLSDAERSFEIELPDQTGIDMDVRRELFLIYKELIHNAARHSAANRLDVELMVRGSVLTLRVADDGRGFDTTAVSDGSGLRSVHARARQLGASLTLESRPGDGTTAAIELDLARTRHGRAAD